MKVGLFFGSFNPVHHGHLIIANYVVQHTDLEQVWLVISPLNPLKNSSGLLNEYHRYYLVQLAVESEKSLRASDIEFRLPKPSYTVNTLTYLKEKFPNNIFSIIMGSDSFQNISRWKNYEYLLQHYEVYVYVRRDHEKVESYSNAKIHILKAPMLEISATYIRKNIRDGKSIRYLVPDKILEEIERNGYYKQ